MRVIIAAAGTGGHINPGIAIANKIKEKNPDAQIVFMGTNRGLENDLVPRAGYELKQIESYGYGRQLTIENIKKVFKNFKGIKQAKQFIKEFKPDIVIGTGGYICVAVCIAAKRYKVPFVLHESNAFPGVSIKMMAKSADCVLVGFEDAKTRIPKAKKIVVTGTPTKIKEMNLKQEEKDKIKLELGFSLEKPLVLVFGGSQGAKSINTTMVDLLEEKMNKNYQIMWAAGPKHYDGIKENLEKKKLEIDHLENAKIVPYIYNMQEVMEAADIVVCRSGAMTINEIELLGKPAIFIPFPFAAENHQEFNARVLEKADAAKVIIDKDLDENALNTAINDMIKTPERLQKMSRNAKRMTIGNVEDKIYEEIEKVLKQKQEK